jgi:hypothetical protein
LDGWTVPFMLGLDALVFLGGLAFGFLASRELRT